MINRPRFEYRINHVAAWFKALMGSVVLCLSLVASQVSSAVELTSLYRVDVVVADQSQAARQQAVTEAYQTLIVRLSGSEQALFNELIQRRQATAESLIASLRYRPSEQQLLLQIEFAEEQVTQLLVTAGESVWGSNRPRVKTWIVQSSEEGAVVIGHEPKRLVEQAVVSQPLESMDLDPSAMVESDIATAEFGQSDGLENSKDNDIEPEMVYPPTQSEALQEAYTAIGLPWSYPTQQELNQFPVLRSDVFSVLPQLQSAYRRRNANEFALLGGYIEVTGPTRIVRLELLYADITTDIQFVDDSNNPRIVARRISLQVAAAIAARQAVSYRAPIDGDTQTVQLDISNVSSFEQYMALMDYLSNHLAIKAVTLRQVTGTQVQLELRLSAVWSEVQRVFSREQRLSPTNLPNRFLWQGQ